MTTTTTDALRHADLATLAQALNEQRTRALDVVAPAGRLRAVLGAITLAGVDPVVGDDGVTSVDGSYLPTHVGDEGLATKLGIPSGYLRRCRNEATDLWDANVNGWLARDSGSYLLRLLTHPDGPRPDGSAGVLRAFLSDRYRTIDNLDVLLAMLEGITAAGVQEAVIEADLTERRMVVRVTAPAVAALARGLLASYRNPWGGQNLLPGTSPRWMEEHNAQLLARGRAGGYADADPVVFAGFVVTNSETGQGAFNITPRLVVRACLNGLVITADALSKVHIGGRLDEGVIAWSAGTTRKALDLIASQTADAVRTYLDEAYVTAKASELEAKAGIPVADPAKVVASVSKRLGFTDEQARSILSMFIAGGQVTCGGVMQAVTAAAQAQPDADDAWEMELRGLAALDAAALAVRAT